jgi:putrescine transport system ATP-binding protein
MRAAAVNHNRMRERPIGWDERVWLTFSSDAALVLTK